MAHLLNKLLLKTNDRDYKTKPHRKESRLCRSCMTALGFLVEPQRIKMIHKIGKKRKILLEARFLCLKRHNSLDMCCRNSHLPNCREEPEKINDLHVDNAEFQNN